MGEPLELALIKQIHAEELLAFKGRVVVLLNGLLAMLDDLDHLDVPSVKATLRAMAEELLETVEKT